jgi:hypothetical protein
VAKRNGPTRAEFDRLRREIATFGDMHAATERDLAIQFQRIAEMQAEIDVIRASWSKIRPKNALRRVRPR